ncbi:MAG: LegC family aminotransferase [Prosthecobacter sp.]|uniref:LegC family aminotransferase n=1 Tax=Prosthecobacter sp. TaxID=1965333 RepID=UPI0039002D24
MSSDAAFIPLSAPHLSGNEWKYIKDCLDTGWVSSVGAYVTRFEHELAQAAAVPHAVATTCGTAALHMALLVAGVKPGDEVLVSSMTFIAPVNAIRYANAIPVLVDAEPKHWQMDVNQVRDFLTNGCVRRDGGVFNRVSGRRVAAIVPVHVLGHPVDMNALMKLADEFDLTVIEDATESLGSTYFDRPAGGIGHLGCYSFNGNKIITTGGGGMLVTANEAWAKKARYLTTQAKDDPQEYIHHEIGYNYRLTNIQAAFGCAQIEVLPGYVTRRREIHALYRSKLGSVPGIRFQEEADGVKSNFWLTTVCIDRNLFGMEARALQQQLKAAKIEARPLWQPAHLSPAHQDAFKLPCPVAEDLFANALSLPSCSSATDEDIKRVIQVVHHAAGL